MGKKQRERKVMDFSEDDDGSSTRGQEEVSSDVDDNRIEEGSDWEENEGAQLPQESSALANDAEDGDDDGIAKTKKQSKKVRKLKLSATEDFNAKLKKRGVVYLSRVPPRMGPAKVKTLLSDFGTITRVYLVEEDKTVRKKRRKAGGSGGKRYTEGWVEFESKKAAKLVGETLNMSRITNHKRSIHYDDVWNIKYLRGFKWAHLTEKVAYERRVREQKLRVEMMEVRRENASYIAQVEAGKKLDYIEDRRRKRQEKEGSGGGGDVGDGDNIAKKKRKIRQKKTFGGDESSTKSAILRSLV